MSSSNMGLMIFGITVLITCNLVGPWLKVRSQRRATARGEISIPKLLTAIRASSFSKTTVCRDGTVLAFGKTINLLYKQVKGAQRPEGEEEKIAFECVDVVDQATHTVIRIFFCGD